MEEFLYDDLFLIIYMKYFCFNEIRLLFDLNRLCGSRGNEKSSGKVLFNNYSKIQSLLDSFIILNACAVFRINFNLKRTEKIKLTDLIKAVANLSQLSLFY